MQHFKLFQTCTKGTVKLMQINAANRLASKSLYSTFTFVDRDEPDLMKSLTDGKKSYATTSSKLHLVPNTIGEIIEAQAEKSPNNLVYAFPHQGLNLTFSQVKQRINQIAQNLLEMGFKKGDRIALSLPNTHELAMTFLAACEIGLISVILNPAYQLTEFEYMLKKTGAKGVFIYDSFKTLNHLELIRKICPELDQSETGKIKSKNLPNLQHVVVLNSPLIPEKRTYKGTWKFTDISESKLGNGHHELPYVDIDDPCLILFTVISFL